MCRITLGALRHNCGDLELTVSKPVPRGNNPGWIYYIKLITDEVQFHKDIIFYGDNIFEQWAGREFVSIVNKSYVGQSYKHLDTFKSQFDNFFGNLRTEIAAVSGTEDIKAIKCRLGRPNASNAINAIIERIEDIVELLRNRLPTTHILLTSLLPLMDVENKTEIRWPNKLTAPVQSINAGLQAIADNEVIHYNNCSSPFEEDHTLIDVDKGEGTVPTLEGMFKLAQCVKYQVDLLIDNIIMEKDNPYPIRTFKRTEINWPWFSNLK